MSKKPGERSPANGIGPRLCPACASEFQPYRSNQIFCSRPCRERGQIAVETRKAYRLRPDVRERALNSRRLATAHDPVAIQRRNLRGALKKYGVTLEWYEAKLKEQQGRCILCGHTPPADGIKAASRLHVDHDHATGVVRDLLCTRCNQGVGFLRDDPDLMRRAAEYIEHHRQGQMN